jgi:putative oxidoreductase
MSPPARWLISRFNEEEDMKVPTLVAKPYGLAAAGLDFLAPLFDLALRLFVAWAFFRSGLVKIQSWDATLYLFENEYAVPFLPPEIAAYLGTAAELTLPVFLALGLGTRFAVLALFVFNAVAVISYPDLSPAGLKDHLLWGALMLVTLFHGPGRLSLDAWLCRRVKA